MEQRIKMAFEIRELGVKSVPINVLNPIKGTPFENVRSLSPDEILRTIALFRLIMPMPTLDMPEGGCVWENISPKALKPASAQCWWETILQRWQ